MNDRDLHDRQLTHLAGHCGGNRDTYELVRGIFARSSRRFAAPPGCGNHARAMAWLNGGEYIIRFVCEECGGAYLIRRDERAHVEQHFAGCPRIKDLQPVTER